MKVLIVCLLFAGLAHANWVEQLENESAADQGMSLDPHDYRFSRNKWNRTNLTFKIIRYTVDQTRAKVRDAIERAMEVWTYETPLTFTEVDADTDADIKITFEYGKHDGCFYDLDGTTWGHTYYPPDGRMHLDDHEDWTVRNTYGTNLYYAVAHELGHALGLKDTIFHSPSADVMSSYKRRYYQEYITLSQRDRERIQMLYGAITHCEERRIDYNGNDVNKISNVATWEACSNLCRHEVTCAYWSWTDARAPNNDARMLCILKSSNAGRRYVEATTSGARDCGPAWTDWTAWSECCEGLQRSGRTCPYQSRDYVCKGERTRTQTCESQATCPSSALAWNCWMNDCESILKEGLDPNYPFSSGLRALHRASQYARAEKVKVLLKYGANPDASKWYGWTPLMMAGKDMSNKGAGTAIALIANGASLDATNFKGYTALMYAVENPNQDTAKVLLACGANRNIRNNDGETAEEMIKHLYGRWTQTAIDYLKEAFKTPGECLA